jgi:hypothetical protein
MPEQAGDEFLWTSGGLKAEYIHPHGSTPGFTAYLPGGEVWDVEYPDLHKFVFPMDENFTGDEGFILHSNVRPAGSPACGFPYEDPQYGDETTTPYGTDFPWYNPIYPESSEDIAFDRGTIELYGGLYERRSQEVKCNGLEGDHHQNSTWDPSEGLYGGTHLASGYDINYHFDPRLSYPGFMDGLCETLVDSNYELTILTSSDGGENFVEQLHQEWTTEGLTNWQPLLCAIENNQLGFLYSTTSGILYHTYNLENQNLESDVIGVEFYKGICSFQLIDNIPYFNDGYYILSYENGVIDYLVEMEEDDFYDFQYLPGYPINWKARETADALDFTFYLADENWNLNEVCEMSLNETAELDISHIGNVHLAFDSHQTGKVILNTSSTTGSCLFLVSGEIENISPLSQDVLPAVMSVSVYPNPFILNNDRENMNINYSLPASENGSLALYNLRGQQLKEWQITGSGTIPFNPSELSSGLYLLKMKGQSQNRFQKFLLIK